MAISLKAARINAGLKQNEAAKLAGIVVSTLDRYERGLIFPKVSLAQKLSKLYGLNLDDIAFLKIDREGGKHHECIRTRQAGQRQRRRG